MNRRAGLIIALVFVALAALVLLSRRHFPPPREAVTVDAGQPSIALPQLAAIGPRLLSNQTSQPIIVYGDQLEPGLTLSLGTPFNRKIALVPGDGHHAFARLPADLRIDPNTVQQDVTCTIEGGIGAARITIVNDAAYPDFFAMTATADGTRYVISPTTDTLYVQSPDGGTQTSATNDGPYALAIERTDAGERVWIAHRYSPTLQAFEGNTSTVQLPAPSYASAIAIDSKSHIAYVAETARDSVSALDLSRGGRELWRTPVAPNPGVLALAGKFLAVGSQQTGEIELLNLSTGKAEPPIAPGPDVSIVGGPTEKFGPRVMGGKAPRAFLYVPSNDVLLVSSIGPNIGPNPEKMEVSMNGGIGVVDLKARKFVRHLGFGAGVTEGLATNADPKRPLVFAADIGAGLVRVVDLEKLLANDTSARASIVAEIAISPPEEFPLIRPPSDFGVNGRAGKELHSGPRSVSFVNGELLALNRHTATIAELTSNVRPCKSPQGVCFAVRSQLPLALTNLQRTRRTGQVLYYADLGRTAMSCDACHLEGHTESVLFEKTQPLRIYRSPTVRGSRESPPYFIPASTFSIAETAKVVGGRNRFHNPNPTDSEVEALAQYTAAITLVPNPFVKSDGSFADELQLPDGHTGHPMKGLRVFEKQKCGSCHPAPVYTTDQDPPTRGKQLDVGTPHLLPLRPELQDATFRGFPPPSLEGSWDVWPQLTSGLAGFAPGEDGRLRVTDRWATRAVIDHYSGPQHGNAQSLSPQERDDLLAFLMSL
ncbi:MAG: MtsA protein [Myxococcaceae bacterium]